MAAVKTNIRLFLEESEHQTRLELFLKSRGIRPMSFAREASISRQHILRARKGRLEPSRRKIAAMVSAARRLAMEPIRPEDLFELTAEEGGLWINAELRERAIRAATAHVKDRKAAAELVRSLAASPVPTWSDRIRKHKGGVTEPIIRRLIHVGYAELDRDPGRAHEILILTRGLISDLRTTMSEVLVAFRGRTLLYGAHALLQMGKYSDALAALDLAEREYEGAPFCTNELAQTWYERATLLFKSGKLEEAERLVKRAISIFTLLGDSRRVAKSRIIQAGIFYERGDVAAARTAWLLVIEPMRLAEDREAVACVSLNLGSAETLLGDVTSAKVWLQSAVRDFTKLGIRGEVIRARWSMAKLRLLHEDRADGLRLLRLARSDFLTAGMPTEAGFVTLDLVEQLLEEEKSNDEAAALCRSAVTAFQQAGATQKLLEALAHLREAIRRQTADTELVREVRVYLEQAARGRDVMFTPRAR